jgi:two-component system CheB/CheR fusion protein
MDLVSCRNLLIYLESVLQKRVVPTLHYALKQGGYLLLGSSEGISGFSVLFTSIDKKHKIYRKKPGITHLEFKFTPAYYAPLDGKEKPEKLPAKEFPKTFTAQEEANQVLLNKYAPASVLVNDDMEILNFWGHSGVYLEHTAGKASFNLMNVIREELSMEVRTAIHEARKNKIGVRREKIGFRHNGHDKYTNVEVVPIKDPASEESYFLVMFEDVSPTVPGGPEEAKPAAATKSGRARTEHKDREIAHLRNELEKAREYLQSVIEGQETASEELKSSLEELQSSNEELQSTNEELETAKEELQSANEELATVNEELEVRNTELAGANNDMTNLLGSIDTSIVMLRDDLSIRRFNSTAQKMLNLLPADVGRKFTDIRSKINIADMEETILSVIDTLKVKENELQDSDGHWYSVRIRPYMTHEKKIEGVVISVVDVDKIKRISEEIKEARDYAESIVETVREPLIVLDANLKVITANRSFYKTFNVSPKNTEKQFIYGLGNKQWDIPELRKLLKEVLLKKAFFYDFEVECEFPRIGKKTMLLNARQLRGKGDKLGSILLAMEDRTERKAAEVFRSNLLRSVSHSLKTPLSTAKMAVNALSKGITKKDMNRIKRGRNIILDNLQKIYKDVTNILTLHALSATTKPRKEKSSLSKTINELARDSKYLLEEKNLKLRKDIDKRADNVAAQKNHLKLILENLIDNAIKFSHKGSIKITSKLKGDQVEVRVKDSGCGMKASDTKRVFDAFYKKNLSTKGVGLGLSIAKEVISLYNGKIEARSSGAGKGSTFIFTLPAK